MGMHWARAHRCLARQALDVSALVRVAGRGHQRPLVCGVWRKLASFCHAHSSTHAHAARGKARRPPPRRICAICAICGGGFCLGTQICRARARHGISGRARARPPRHHGGYVLSVAAAFALTCTSAEPEPDSPPLARHVWV
eukprot:scaffold1732_cov117-Isochrysis_galbana.AAC.4